MIMRFITRKMMVPRRIVKVEDEGLARTRRDLMLRERPEGEWCCRTPYGRIEGGIERVEKYWRLYTKTKVRTFWAPKKGVARANAKR